MSVNIWQCPVCGASLYRKIGSFQCEKGHSFDRARSGYVHLLPANRQHAKLPGDNPEMVRARRRFLNQDFYGHLSETLAGIVVQYLPLNGVLLDAGCGEGYYLRSVRKAAVNDGKIMEQSGSFYGVDISKTAADMAARADKLTEYAVGSVFHLPVRSESCDIVMSVFAPYCGEEFLRVLKPDGFLVMAIPAARHLWSLKAAVYEHPYENAVKDYALEGFAFTDKIETSRQIFLETKQDIADLFGMTPYAYRTGRAERERLDGLENLVTEAAFEVLVYRKV
jgi:23S rRNA (guanine745-N1)-methyltransferase